MKYLLLFSSECITIYHHLQKGFPLANNPNFESLRILQCSLEVLPFSGGEFCASTDRTVGLPWCSNFAEMKRNQLGLRCQHRPGDQTGAFAARPAQRPALATALATAGLRPPVSSGKLSAASVRVHGRARASGSGSGGAADAWSCARTRGRCSAPMICVLEIDVKFWFE